MKVTKVCCNAVGVVLIMQEMDCVWVGEEWCEDGERVAEPPLQSHK